MQCSSICMYFSVYCYEVLHNFMSLILVQLTKLIFNLFSCKFIRLDLIVLLLYPDYILWITIFNRKLYHLYLHFGYNILCTRKQIYTALNKLTVVEIFLIYLSFRYAFAHFNFGITKLYDEFNEPTQLEVEEKNNPTRGFFIS